MVELGWVVWLVKCLLFVWVRELEVNVCFFYLVESFKFGLMIWLILLLVVVMMIVRFVVWWSDLVC